MCEIASIVVHPTTLEVWHEPGVWSHHLICSRNGLNYDQVFKPDVVIATRHVKFSDYSIAMRQEVPSEILAMLERQVRDHHPGAQMKFDCSLVWDWTREHQNAAVKWMNATIPSAKKLVEFSEHTFSPEWYAATLRPKEQAELKMYQPYTPRQTELVRQVWKKTFEKGSSYRSLAWRGR